MDYAKESLKLHYELRGKLEIQPRVKVDSREALSLAYTPGVAEPCLEIRRHPEKSFELTRRWNTVAVVTDGTAILGLGDIGPEAGMPVMEGKCVLFKAFGGVDAIPLCIRSKDVDEIVRTVWLLSGSFGGVNLEDISAPRCFEIERRLQELCDIPIFHDDQHGTAVVVGAALINALKVVGKRMGDVRVVINGAGSAGIAIGKHLLNLGVRHLKLVDRCGILCEGADMNPAQKEMADRTNPEHLSGTLADAMRGADVFVGVSAPGVVSEEMIRSMAKDPIVFPMANPVPEIAPELAKAAGAAVVGTGRSDHPNQINNVLVFPGLFRGALDVRASRINEAMKQAASFAIANLIPDEELSAEYVIPAAFDPRVGTAVAEAVRKAAIESGAAPRGANL
jgi:malate dehydrogenase (oxaloacetate-decarboxylating)